MKRTIYTVQPGKGSIGMWEVTFRTSGGETGFVGPGYRRKYEAVRFGRDLARGMWRDRQLPSQLRIKGRNGRIQTEHTYGRDPKRYKG